MGRLETNGYYALGVPLYLLLAAWDIARARRTGTPRYHFAVTLGNLAAGLGEVVIGLFIGPYLLALYDWAFARIALVHWPRGSLVPWVLAFLLGDLCYYAYHRAGHRVGALWAIHGVHHQSEDFNLTIALRHPWFSDFYSAIFYAPLPLLGVPPGHFFVAITLISFYALTIHSHTFRRPGLFVFVTPASHVVHHAVNPRYRDRNYGAMFTLWDRLFGTHAEVDPADPPRLGTTAGYATHDGALAQWVFWARLIAVARRARSLGEALAPFVRPPGYRPPGVAPLPPAPPPRGDAAIPRALKVFTAAQFAATVALAMYILWLREQHATWVRAAGAAVVLVSLGTIGGLLDGRRRASRHELARLGATAAFGAALLAGAARGALVGGVIAAGALASAAWLALIERGADRRGEIRAHPRAAA